MIRTALWLLPSSRFKRWSLTRLGDRIDATARLGPILVIGKVSFAIGPGVRISPFNIFRNLRSVEVGENSTIGSFNLFTAHKQSLLFWPDGASLRIQREAFITSRHSFDCTASVSLADFAAIGGYGTQILTHSLDFARNVQTGEPVSVGSRTFVGSRCLVLAGVAVPEMCLIGAGSVLAKGSQWTPGHLLAGIPAVDRRPISGDWFSRAHGPSTTILNGKSGDKSIAAFD